MRAPRLGKAGKIAALLLSLPKSGLAIEEFNAIIRADHGSLPVYLEKAKTLIEAMNKVSGSEAPEGMQGAAIGKWIFAKQVKILIDFKVKQ